jgi:hypothetical protein
MYYCQYYHQTKVNIILSLLYLAVSNAQKLQYFVRIRIIILLASTTAVTWHGMVITRVSKEMVYIPSDTTK